MSLRLPSPLRGGFKNLYCKTPPISEAIFDEYDYCDIYEEFSISEYGPTDIVIAKVSNGYYISFADMCSSAPKLLSLDDVDFLAELAHDATYRGVYCVAIALAINLIAQDGF